MCCPTNSELIMLACHHTPSRGGCFLDETKRALPPAATTDTSVTTLYLSLIFWYPEDWRRDSKQTPAHSNLARTDRSRAVSFTAAHLHRPLHQLARSIMTLARGRGTCWRLEQCHVSDPWLSQAAAGTSLLTN
jgi:hypothetical protein